MITCEECGYEGLGEDFVMFQGEVALCRNLYNCKLRQGKVKVGHG